MQLIINLNQAGFDLGPEDLEAYCLKLANELQSDVADTASLIAGTNLPENAMAGGGELLAGFLQAEVNKKNLSKAIGWLWSLRPKASLKITYKRDGKEVTVEYQTSEQLAEQLEALKEIDTLIFQVIQKLN